VLVKAVRVILESMRGLFQAMKDPVGLEIAYKLHESALKVVVE
jgi:hypothetical protein